MRLSTITVSLCSLRRIRSRGLVGIVVREVVNHSCSTFCFVYLGVRGFIVVVVGQVVPASNTVSMVLLFK
jgi:hypothetical protein